MLRLTIAVFSIFLALPAHAFSSSNRMNVQPAGPVTFEVRARGGGYGAADFWCAAGEYAQRRLSVPGNTRVYRLSEPPRRAGQPIVFSLDPEGQASRTGLASFGSSGASMSVASARNICQQLRIQRRR